MIKLNNVSKSYDDGETFAVKALSLDIATGETLVLLGASGCGKTTLLKMMNRLIEPSSGTIEYAGKPLPEYPLEALRRRMGYVFQHVGLFPHMTIERNVSIVLELMHQPKIQRANRAHELLSLVHLDPKQYANRYPDELSGGQAQRVGVARALAADPDCLLMDEPFGALDAISRKSLQDEMITLKKELNKTIVFVTHDIFEAFRIADRIAVMNYGKIEQIGTKDELVHRPASNFVKLLIKQYLLQLENP